MPTPLKHSQNMKKHLTKAERAARTTAEAGLEHGKRTYMRAPGWLSEPAVKIFRDTVRRLKGFDLLEAIDTDLLANYADAMARYQAGVQSLSPLSQPKDITTVQAWSRIALTLADKLGFSQTARARLARRRAEEEPLDDMERLLNDVDDFVNGDQ